MSDESAKKPDSAKVAAKQDATRHDPGRRFNAPKALGLATSRLTNPVLKKRGAALVDILGHWTAIVGPLLAAETQPERLIYAAGAGHAATLEVAVSPAFALELQHLSPLVVEKINGYFGYRAVAGLKLKQMPIRRPESPRDSGLATRRERHPLTDQQQRQLAEMLAGIEDKSLRQVLESLGRSLLGARR
jgi:hypothetical protein